MFLLYEDMIDHHRLYTHNSSNCEFSATPPWMDFQSIAGLYSNIQFSVTNLCTWVVRGTCSASVLPKNATQCDTYIVIIFCIQSSRKHTEHAHVTFSMYHLSCFSSSCQSTDVSVQLEALDILGDLLSRFGGKKILLLGASPANSLRYCTEGTF